MSAPGPEAIGASAATQVTEPAWVRNGSPQVQREYALGLEFERLLVQQLATSLTETTEPAGEGETQEGSGGSTSVLSNMLPGALADGVVNGGGLGLAAELTKGMQPAAATPPKGSSTTTPSGGVQAAHESGAGK